ncbi:MAG: sensor histidine kinase [Thermoleophilia bacterium]
MSQTLFSLSLQAAAAQKELRQVQHPGERLPRALGEVSSLAAGSLAEMRALIFELMPGALAEEGLVAALRKQAAAVSAREDLPVQVAGPEGRLPLTPEAEEHLYRIAQEALANVVKHAGAMRVGIEVTTPPGRVALRVADDGQGFDPDAVYAGHMGLHTMRARAEDAHGGLTIRRAAGSIGTEVEAWVPVRA